MLSAQDECDHALRACTRDRKGLSNLLSAPNMRAGRMEECRAIGGQEENKRLLGG